MTEEMLTKLIKPELLVLVPVLYLVGCAIKKSAIPDRIIPFALGFIGIVLTGLYLFATTRIQGAQDVLLALFSALTQGVLVAGASVYANQLYKQGTAVTGDDAAGK